MLNSFYKTNCRINDWFWDREDGYQLRYARLVNAKNVKSRVTVDLGAGSVNLCSRFPEVASIDNILIPCDLDEQRLKANPNQRCVVANGAELPFADASVDLIVSDNAFEHLTDPDAVLTECARILKSEGHLVFATPNRYSYISLLAAVAPFRWHSWVRKLQGASTIDVTETFYRANTVEDINQRSHTAGLEVISVDCFVGAPCYTLRMPPPIHLLFVLVHCLMDRIGMLRRTLAITLVGVLQRPPKQHIVQLKHELPRPGVMPDLTEVR